MTDDTTKDTTSNSGTTGTTSDRRVSRKNTRGLLSFRNITIVSLGVVGAAVAFELWRNPDLVGGSRIAEVPNVDATPAGEQLRDSERYQNNLRSHNEQGAETATSDGGSFIATPDEPLRDIDEPPATVETNPNRPLPPANRVVEPPASPVVIERPANPVLRRQATTQAPAPDYSQINQLAQLMAAQQQGLLSSWQTQPSAVTVVIEQNLAPEPEASDLGSGKSASSTNTTSEPLVRAGDVVLASTIITNDSDTPGPVVVEIRRGPLQGARLIGGFQANQNNTHLIVQFNSAVLPDGTPVPVSAYAVDARQKCLAVRSDLDRRLFARYAPRVAAAFVPGLGEALSNPGSTLVDLGGGVAGITRPQATFEQGVYQGLAEVGNDLAGEFVRAAPKGPLISLRSRQIVGVLFLQNVDAPN